MAQNVFLYLIFSEESFMQGHFTRDLIKKNNVQNILGLMFTKCYIFKSIYDTGCGVVAKYYRGDDQRARSSMSSSAK